MKHGHYSPSTKSADINRLLDPSYVSSMRPTPSPASSSSSSSYAYTQPKVYVDHRGDLHDPDYRHFPAMPQHNDHSRRRRKQQNRSSSDWGFQYRSEEDDEDSEPEDETEMNWQGRPSHTSATSPRRGASQRRSLSPSHHATYFPYSSTNTSPSSYTSTPLSTSPESVSSSCHSSPRKLSKAMPRCSFDEPSTTHVLESSSVEALDLYDDDDNDDESQQLTPTMTEKASADDVPSCTDALRKEWQSVQLSMRIRVFRMKKRLGITP